MTVTTHQPDGTKCQECRGLNRMADARRVLVTDMGQQWHLCLNCAAVYIHRHDLYDQAMNPKGKK